MGAHPCRAGGLRRATGKRRAPRVRSTAEGQKGRHLTHASATWSRLRHLRPRSSPASFHYYQLPFFLNAIAMDDPPSTKVTTKLSCICMHQPVDRLRVSSAGQSITGGGIYTPTATHWPSTARLSYDHLLRSGDLAAGRPARDRQGNFCASIQVVRPN
uniref:Uncharacterized protein n=1 Tax=Triticum urartu TaxID=4572 RepID=A0A8R7TTJ5_TRIUA